MSKDMLTTIAGLMAAIGTGMGTYVHEHPDMDGGWGWYIGMGSAVAMVIWAYFTNKKDE